MGPSASSRDLEACRMSNEAPTVDEVAARVRAAIAGDFKPEHVNLVHPTWRAYPHEA